MLKNIKYSFLLFVILPTVVAFFYYYFIATPRYVVNTRFAITSNQQNGAMDALAGLGAALSTGVSKTSDAYIIKSYIHSLDILGDIAKKEDVKSYFTNKDIDFLSRLNISATQKDTLDYWKSRVKVGYETNSGILDISVNAFSAEQTLKLSELILSSSEKIVNDLSIRARKDTLLFAETELTRAEKTLFAVKEKVKKFRTDNLALDPAKTAEGQLSIVNTLEGELAKAQAELSSLKSYARPTAPAVQALEAKVQGLKRQIANEENKLSFSKRTTNNKEAMPGLLDEYDSLLIEREFAEKLYASALTSLEGARMEANKQQRYLTVFVKPQLPDEAILPSVPLDTLGVFLAAFLMWGIGSIAIASTKDHLGWV